MNRSTIRSGHVAISALLLAIVATSSMSASPTLTQPKLAPARANPAPAGLGVQPAISAQQQQHPQPPQQAPMRFANYRFDQQNQMRPSTTGNAPIRSPPMLQQLQNTQSQQSNSQPSQPQLRLPRPPPLTSSEEVGKQQLDAKDNDDSSPLNKDFLRKIGALNSGNVSFNNNVSKVSIGNNHQTSVNTVSHVSAPIINNSRLHNLDSRVGSSTGAQDGPAPRAPQTQVDANTESSDQRLKKHATPEQKELKAKLIELTNKATGDLAVDSEAPLLKFNPQTGDYEPVAADATTAEAKEKLVEAIKSLSARKLPADKLRNILGAGREDIEASEAYQDSDGDGIPDNEEVSVNQAASVDNFHPQEQSTQEHPVLKSTGRRDSEVVSGPMFPIRSLDEPFSYASSQTGYYEDSMAQPESRHLYEQPSGNGYSSSSHSQTSYSPKEYQVGYQSPVYQNQYETRSATTTLGEPDDEVKAALDDRLNRISDLLYFRPEFMNQLLQINDPVELTPLESEFKRMVLCNSDEQFCLQDISSMSGLEPADEQSQPDYQHEEYVDENQPQYSPQQLGGQYVDQDQPQYQIANNAPTGSNPNIFRRSSSSREFVAYNQHRQSIDGAPEPARNLHGPRPTTTTAYGNSPQQQQSASYGASGSAGASAFALRRPGGELAASGSPAAAYPSHNQPAKVPNGAYRQGANGFSTATTTYSSSSSSLGPSGQQQQQQAQPLQQQPTAKSPSRDAKQFSQPTGRQQQQQQQQPLSYPRY